MKPHSKDNDITLSPQAEHRPCVLIVDGDKVSQRAIELALASSKYAIEWVRNGEAAFDILRRVRVDIIVADSLLADMPGITLVRRTIELCGPAAPTFLFVSADRATTTKLGLLMVGASDYMVKPFIADELRLRVKNNLEARRRLRAEAVRGVTGLAGDAAHVPIPDILTMLELTRKSGVLYISVGPTSGRVVLEEGRLAHAEVGNLVGADAFFVLLQYNAGLYRFEPGAIDCPRTIQHRVSEMLLESAIREDSARNERLHEGVLENTITSTAASLRELGIVKSSIDLRSRSVSDDKPPPLTELTTRLGIAVADTYLLGDLVLADEIATTSTAQFRIELWATLGEGVSALLALASSPGYQFLAAALGDHASRLHLQFETSHGAVIVTLVDIETGDLPEHPPHSVVIVPPRGELVTLAPQRLADLTARIDDPLKPVMIAFGGPALQSTLGRVVDEAGHGFRYLGLPGKLEDLRDVIGGALRLWNASR